MSWVEVIFFLSLFLLFYTYFIYPFIIYFISKLKCNHLRLKVKNLSLKVSVLISAYNEEEVIEEKINNCLSIDYPNLEIILGIDCSTDRTYEIAQKYSDKIIIKNFTNRCGKMSVLNNLVNIAKGDIIVFTDANSIVKSDAIKNLVSNFTSQDIGCVCGAKRVKRFGKIGLYESKYWDYDNFIKLCESKFGKTYADGSLYAVRKEAYPYPPADKIIMDDLAVSLGIINKGYKVLFEPNAIAYETASKDLLTEFSRKIRIIEGALTAIKVYSIKKVLFQIISHKILRWLTFTFLILLFISNLFLEGKFFINFLILQIIFYLSVLLGFIFYRFKIKVIGSFLFPFYFFLTSLAQIVGIVKYFLGKGLSPYWEKLDRE